MNSNLLDVWNLNSLWKLLSSIKNGDKLSIRGNLIEIDRDTPLLFLKRKYYGDKRSDIFNFVDYLFEITEHHLKNETHVLKSVESFKRNIIDGIKGLLNLKETYKDDNSFLSSFYSSLERISLLKKYYNEKEPEYNLFIDIESKIVLVGNNETFEKTITNVNIN
tara:strand:- start:738 stop:1229 length:492 start_codon:yes stop_codon:yes gene_type:complete